MPMIQRCIKDVSGKAPSTRLQPDLAVAQGAAVFAAILQFQGSRNDEILASGEEFWITDPAFRAAAEDVSISNVNSRSLGVVVRSPRYDKLVNRILIKRNSSLPVKMTESFATRFAGQRKIRIPVVEGEERDISKCAQIGECIIDGLPIDLPAGSRVAVSFSYSSSGLVDVKAIELSTGRSGRIQLDVNNATGAPIAAPADTLDDDAPTGAIGDLARVVAEMKR